MMSQDQPLNNNVGKQDTVYAQNDDYVWELDKSNHRQVCYFMLWLCLFLLKTPDFEMNDWQSKAINQLLVLLGSNL